MNRLFAILLWGLSLVVSVSAQDRTCAEQVGDGLKEVRISGTVVDKTTRDKLKSVSITVPHTNISTVTNDEGYFLLKLKTCPENLVVSSLGYKQRYVNLEDGKLEGLRIKMTPVAIVLPELNVWQDDPAELVKTAINHIHDNFVQSRELQTSFYRETLQKGSRYIDISEAILTTCKKGYDDGTKLDRVKVKHGRHLVSQRAKDTISIKVQGGPMTALNYDAVKNYEVLIDDMLAGCYSFMVDMPEELDDREQIVIDFFPRMVMDWPLFNGRILLDRQTLAFTRIEMTLDVSDKQKATQMLLVKKPAGLRFKPLELTTVVNYRDGRINYMRNLFRFKCDWKKHLFSRSYTSCSEMVVTDFISDYDGPNIESGDRMSEKDILTSKIDKMYDSDFWRGYNIIEPTESLEKGIGKLKN